MTLSTSLKLISPSTPAQSKDYFIGTQSRCSTSPRWLCRPEPGLCSSFFSPCSGPWKTPLTQGCSCPTFGLLGGCQQLQDSHVQGFLRTSFSNWALGRRTIMTLVCQVFFYVGREREGQGKCPDWWIFFAAVAESWLSID